MKILAIDTSSIILSIAISENKDVIREESHLLDRQHSRLLVPKIKDMLSKVRVPIDKIDAFIIGLGPGSFTGLRIGVSTVKGFGIATGRPCIGVASIDALALNVHINNPHHLIVPIIDAKRGNVYSAIYKKKGYRVIRLSGYQLESIDKLMENFKDRADVIFLGDGVALYKERIEEANKNSDFLGEEYWYPKADNLIRLTFRDGNLNRKNDLSKLKPIYLYPQDCQVRGIN